MYFVYFVEYLEIDVKRKIKYEGVYVYATKKSRYNDNYLSFNQNED